MMKHLNEKYMRYYRKDGVPTIRQCHCRRASSLVDVVIPKSRYVFESIDDAFFLCINDPNSLTNAIRKLECNEYFMSEEEHEVCSIDELTSAWKDICKKFFDKSLLSLSYNDIGVSYGDNNGNIVNNPLVLSRGKKNSNDALAMQFIVPFFSKNAGTHKLKDFVNTAIDTFYKLGYNFSSLNAMHVKRQPLIDKVELLIMTFEAIYSEVVDELSDDIYHITSLNALKSIKKNGIIPKACKSGNFQHPKRVYLFSNASVNNMLDFINERFGIEEHPCMLKVNKQVLVSSNGFKTGKLKFYVDPMFTQKYGTIALFTDTTIPAMLIDDEVICFKFDIYKNVLKDKTIHLKDL